MAEAGNILDLIKDNWYILIFVVLGVLIYIMWTKRKPKKIQISRDEIQRHDYVKAHKLNFCDELKTLKIGNKTLGQIVNITGGKAPRNDGGDLEDVWEITYRPYFLGFPNPLGTLVPLIVTRASTWTELKHKRLYINSSASIIKHFKADIWYEITDAVNLKNFVTDNSIYRVDMGKMSDAYYRYGVEQSTYDADKAHITLQKQQDIQLEKERRSRLTGGTAG